MKSYNYCLHRAEGRRRAFVHAPLGSLLSVIISWWPGSIETVPTATITLARSHQVDGTTQVWTWSTFNDSRCRDACLTVEEHVRRRRNAYRADHIWPSGVSCNTSGAAWVVWQGGVPWRPASTIASTTRRISSGWHHESGSVDRGQRSDVGCRLIGRALKISLVSWSAPNICGPLRPTYPACPIGGKAS